MIPEPPKLGWGPKRLQAWADALLAFVVAIRPLPSDTIDISESTKGTRLDISSAGIVEAGSAAAPLPFELTVSSSTGEDPVPMIRVVASTLAGGSSIDLGFAAGDDPPYLLSPSVGVVQAGITIDTNGNVTSRWLEIVASLTADDDTTFYVEIGTITQDEDDNWIVSNSRYGPISATICRNWYASAAPFYGVSWS